MNLPWILILFFWEKSICYFCCHYLNENGGRLRFYKAKGEVAFFHIILENWNVLGWWQSSTWPLFCLFVFATWKCGSAVLIWVPDQHSRSLSGCRRGKSPFLRSEVKKSLLGETVGGTESNAAAGRGGARKPGLRTHAERPFWNHCEVVSEGTHQDGFKLMKERPQGSSFHSKRPLSGCKREMLSALNLPPSWWRSWWLTSRQQPPGWVCAPTRWHRVLPHLPGNSLIKKEQS